MNSDMQIAEIDNVLKRFRAVSLEEISCLMFQNRIETKYIINSARLPELLDSLTECYKILEIKEHRRMPYHNLYFDTANYDFYNQHVRGKLNRYKIRYRRYEATGESFLEIKRKTNKGRVIKCRIPGSIPDGPFNREAADFVTSRMDIDTSDLVPALTNSFFRITLAGFEVRERITLDFKIRFSMPGDNDNTVLPFLAVAELKQEKFTSGSPFRSLMRKSGIYPSGISKYCIGSVLLNDSLKYNMIKPKLLFIKKLENEYTSTSFAGQ
jgi:hypothetical protein